VLDKKRMSDLTLVVDANNMCYRARYAYNLSFRGQPTSVTYGVMRMLMALINKQHPSSVVFCWDAGIPAFRRRLVPEYKAGRKERKADDNTWPAFVVQLNELQKALDWTGVLQVHRFGIEADDLIAQAARMLIGNVMIVSSDDDLLQCVTDKVSVLKPGKKDRLLDNDNFEEEVGYPPHKHVLAKVLQGDGSDNVAGVKGIGPKTVAKMLQHDNPFSAASPMLQQRIQAHVQSGKYSAAYTVMDLGPDFAGARRALLEAEWKKYNKKLYTWCIQWGFTSIIEAGSLGKIFGSLRQPQFDITGMRIPRVWDYNRHAKTGVSHILTDGIDLEI